MMQLLMDDVQEALAERACLSRIMADTSPTWIPRTFRRHGHEVIDWLADYLSDVESKPVMSQACEPGDVASGMIPSHPPSNRVNPSNMHHV